MKLDFVSSVVARITADAAVLSHIESTLDAGLGQERQQLPIYARRGSQVLEVLSGAAVWLYHQRLLDGDLSGGQGPGVVHPEIIKDLALRDHQQIAVYKALTTWMGRGILQLPPGAGKTRICGAIAGASALERWLYLVPNEELARQTEDAVGEAVSRAGSQLVCRSFGSVTQLELEEAEGLLIDEVHTLGAKGRALVVAGASNAEMRIGLSATALDRQDQGNSLVVGLTGPIIFSLGCEVLVDRGVLAKGHVTRIAVPY